MTTTPNWFGPCDNFDTKKASIIPATIRKCIVAKLNNTKLTITGACLTVRSFIFCCDIANILLWRVLDTNCTHPSMYIHAGFDFKIHKIVEMIAQICQFPKQNIIYEQKLNQTTSIFEKIESDDNFSNDFCQYLNNDTFYIRIFKESLIYTIDWFLQNH
jgi:GDP-L-fucose synthase